MKWMIYLRGMALLSLCSLISCQRVGDPGKIQDFIAELENLKDGVPVKLSFVSSYTLVWDSTDQVAAYSESGEKSIFSVSKLNETAQKAVFQGFIDSKVELAVYPTSITGADPGRVFFPETQICLEDRVNAAILPLSARVGDDGDYEFRHLCSVFCIRLQGNGEIISDIRFRANEPISGTALIKNRNGLDYLEFLEGGGEVLTLDCSSHNGSHLSPERVSEFYLVLPPLRNPVYTMRINTVDGKYMSLTYRDLGSVVPFRGSVIKTPVVFFKESHPTKF